MLKTVKQAFKVPEMRSKIFFTILMLIVFRVGSCIPVPGINREALASIFTGESGLFDLFDLFSGGSFSNFTIFALSITPYITGSIIIQLLTVAFPYFERLAKEGTEGRKKMAQITRYLTVVLALIQATGLTVGLFRRAVVDQSVFNFIVIILILTAGTAFLMWLGEQINENGIGNGISLLIFAGIVARIPTDIRTIFVQWREGQISIISVILFILFALVVVVGIIMIQQGTRKIPVQYAKRVVGRKMYGGQSTHIPLKVNQAGVIPVIFAMSVLQFPLTVTYFLRSDSGFTQFVSKWLSPSGNPGVWIYAVLNIILIIAFNYFYTTITFNPMEIAQNMKTNGGFIPGYRPGRATIEYLSKVMGRISIVGAIFLAIIATLPTLVSQYTGLSIRFGGTSLLIMIGVAVDMMRQIENQMVMRNYRGFL
ncbi:MAG: preprotein translocase subunit SecY [Clostridia bacterium]|nr:preprotein translocase subunit SecY [Clostridia bacterium]